MVAAGVPTRPDVSDCGDSESEHCADLSMIQWKILDLMRRRRTIDAIAKELDISGRAVEQHIRRILRKLRARSRKELLSRIAKPQ